MLLATAYHLTHRTEKVTPTGLKQNPARGQAGRVEVEMTISVIATLPFAIDKELRDVQIAGCDCGSGRRKRAATRVVDPDVCRRE